MLVAVGYVDTHPVWLAVFKEYWNPYHLDRYDITFSRGTFKKINDPDSQDVYNQCLRWRRLFVPVFLLYV